MGGTIKGVTGLKKSGPVIDGGKFSSHWLRNRKKTSGESVEKRPGKVKEVVHIEGYARILLERDVKT